MKKGFETNQIKDAFRKRQFNLIANHPSAWRERASQLKLVADMTFSVCREATEEYMRISRQKFDNGDFQEGVYPLPEEEAALLRLSGLKSIYLMLIGLAIENLAKGILISRNPTKYMNREGHLRRSIRTHNLVTLVQECGLSLTLDVEVRLGKLTDCAEWSGRYPIPLVSSKMYRFGLGTVHSGIYDSTDYDVAEALYKRLWDLLEMEYKAYQRLDED